MKVAVMNALPLQSAEGNAEKLLKRSTGWQLINNNDDLWFVQFHLYITCFWSRIPALHFLRLTYIYETNLGPKKKKKKTSEKNIN